MVFTKASFLPPSILDAFARRDVGDAMQNATDGSAWFSSQPLTTAVAKPAFRFIFLLLFVASMSSVLQLCFLYFWWHEQLSDIPTGVLLRFSVLELRGSQSDSSLTALAVSATVSSWGLLRNGCQISRHEVHPPAGPGFGPSAAASPLALGTLGQKSCQTGDACSGGDVKWSTGHPAATCRQTVDACSDDDGKQSTAHRVASVPVSSAAQAAADASIVGWPFVSAGGKAEVGGGWVLVGRAARRLLANGFYFTSLPSASASHDPVRWLVDYSTDEGRSWHTLCASQMYRNSRGRLDPLPHLWYAPKWGHTRRSVQQDWVVDPIWALEGISLQLVLAARYLLLAACDSLGAARYAGRIAVYTGTIAIGSPLLAGMCQLGLGRWRLGMMSLSLVSPLIFFLAVLRSDSTKVVYCIFGTSAMALLMYIFNQAVWLGRGWRQGLAVVLFLESTPAIGMCTTTTIYVLYLLALRRARKVVAHDRSRYDLVWEKLIAQPHTMGLLNDLKVKVKCFEVMGAMVVQPGSARSSSGGNPFSRTPSLSGLSGLPGVAMTASSISRTQASFVSLVGGAMVARQLCPTADGLDSCCPIDSLDQLYTQVRRE